MPSPNRLATALALACLAALPTRATAQAPGYQQIDNRAIFAEYHAEVLVQVNELMARWGDAWGDDEPADLADLYWENAVLIRPGHAPFRGREAIQAHLSEALPDVGTVEAFMLDFDASGGMAVVYGNYTLDVDGGPRSGPLVTVYLLKGRTWKIRSQVFADH
jgi:ketosteroid isomerase-like protein